MQRFPHPQSLFTHVLIEIWACLAPMFASRTTRSLHCGLPATNCLSGMTAARARLGCSSGVAYVLPRIAAERSGRGYRQSSGVLGPAPEPGSDRSHYQYSLFTDHQIPAARSFASCLLSRMLVQQSSNTRPKSWPRLPVETGKAGQLPSFRLRWFVGRRTESGWS